MNNWSDFIRDALLAIGGAGAIIFALSTWLGKIWADRILDKEKQALQKQYDLFKTKLDYEVTTKLEDYKKEIELKYSDKAHRRKIYEELSGLVENILLGDPNTNYALQVNKVLGLVAIYAPDDVYLKVRLALPVNRFASAKEIKPVIYSALRKDIFREETVLAEKDIAQHFEKFTPSKRNDK